MDVLSIEQPVPVYALDPDEVTGSRQFRVYNYNGLLPNRDELLVPHRKNHYLIVFVGRAGGIRQWLDMTAYTLRDNSVYVVRPDQIVVKEEVDQVWSTGVAFTGEFLSLQENTSLAKLPIIQNPRNQHELRLSDADVDFVADTMRKICVEHHHPDEWQQRMQRAYLTVLLTYLSHLYTERFTEEETPTDKLLLKTFQAKIDAHFRQLHEVSGYASMLHISAGHLSEVIKDQSGKPASKHIHERLVLEARRLLFHTQQSLKEIAFDLGFSDASYFNRFFKRETGVTPAEYRAGTRKMYQ